MWATDRHYPRLTGRNAHIEVVDQQICPVIQNRLGLAEKRRHHARVGDFEFEHFFFSHAARGTGSHPQARPRDGTKEFGLPALKGDLSGRSAIGIIRSIDLKFINAGKNPGRRICRIHRHPQEARRHRRDSDLRHRSGPEILKLRDAVLSKDGLPVCRVGRDLDLQPIKWPVSKLSGAVPPQFESAHLRHPTQVNFKRRVRPGWNP